MLLTISGSYFDPADTSVFVGGQSCPVVTVDDYTIVCETPSLPQTENGTGNATAYPGSRGVFFELWNDTYSQTPEDVLAWTDPGAIAVTSDDLSWYDPDSGRNHYNTRMRGYFVPPRDNDYQFFVKADDRSYLYFSLAGDPQDKVRKMY